MKKLAIIWMLVFVTYVPIVKAGTNSEKSVLGSIFFGSSVAVSILLAPALVSNSYFDSSAAGSKKIKNASTTKEKCNAKELPDMVVKTIDQDDNNNPRVYFEVPHHPEQNIAISWSKSDDDPTTVFHEGELVSFKPSAHKSGWFLQNTNEVVLAFVPLPVNLADNYSEFF